MKIAILGMGNIGGGVVDVLLSRAADIKTACGEEIEVKYILDLRDFPDHPLDERIIHSIDPVIADPEVSLVVETMGGSHPAREFTLAALGAGKHVVTSNKEVVSHFGDEFTAEAEKHGVLYLFEASVGGGIPLIRPITDSLSSETITGINGIVNGTTNYMLTKIASGTTFDDALAEAQSLGYAERDPSADVDAIDAQRKITILSALTSGRLHCPDDVCTETIRSVTPEDLALASSLGGTVKLIAHAEVTPDGLDDLFTAPCFVPGSSPLAHISDVYNGVMLNCSVSGELMFYGRGAGKYPTAGSIIADIIAAASGKARRCCRFVKAGKETLLPPGEHRSAHFVTAPASLADEIAAAASPCKRAQSGERVAFILPPSRHEEAARLAARFSQVSVYRII